MTALARATESGALDNGVRYALLHRPGAPVTTVSVLFTLILLDAGFTMFFHAFGL